MAASDGPTLDVRLAPERVTAMLHADVLTGLSANPKWLPPKWLYDAHGSELFEAITRLPEYYPTRAEREILSVHAGHVATTTQAASLVDLGSGSSAKTHLLLGALDRIGTLREFVPLDMSESVLRDVVHTIALAYTRVRVHGIVDDFTTQLDIPRTARPRLVAFLGGTIGNLLPDERAKFLTSVREMLDEGDWLLLGTDLVKDPAVLVQAYDDSAGVTAEFNRNVLRVLNRELRADFDLDAFIHVAVWDPGNEWIEMRLRADRSMHVRLPVVDLRVDFDAGAELRTEVSAKFRRDGVVRELATAGFAVQQWWTDSRRRFAVSLSRVT